MRVSARRRRPRRGRPLRGLANAASSVGRVAGDGTGHAMAAAATAPELCPSDGDDFDPSLSEQRVCVSVAVVGEDNAWRGANEIGAAVPLGALTHVVGAAGLDHADFLRPSASRIVSVSPPSFLRRSSVPFFEPGRYEKHSILLTMSG